MATPTYTPIETYTVSGTSTTSVTLGSGGTIPQTYTDLVLVIGGGAVSNILMSFNGIGGTAYSDTYLTGDGSSAFSSRHTSRANMVMAYVGSGAAQSAFIYNIQNYANTNVYKTVIGRANDAGNSTGAYVGLWQNTNAVTSITLVSNGGSYANETKFTLYGIANAAIGAPKATGGIITYDSTYFYHTFGASGTFTPQQSLTADILVVAGGGGGGQKSNEEGGGGGAGGVLGFASQSLTATGYTVTVGNGGAGGSNAIGSNGGNSQFGALTAAVGGGAGGYGGIGNVGGSGGGNAQSYGTNTPAIGTSGQGNSGGTAFGSNPYYGGGGGGYGTAGNTYLGGNGNNTVTNWGSLSGVTSAAGIGVNGYIAGGGGAAYNTLGAVGIGGLGGGGVGGGISSVAGNGVTNTGSGGGGGYDGASKSGGNGGSGVVIIRYLKA
jgi:hypothetical protein